MNKTTLKAFLICLLVLAAGVFFWVHHETAMRLQQEQAARLVQVEKFKQLADENERLARAASNAAAAAAPAQAPTEEHREILKLRGQVGQLRQEQAMEAARRTNTSSALAEMTSNPEMQKMIRDQQKMGMSMLYKDLAKQANLSSDMAEKLNDLLADNVMTNIDQITAALREGKKGEALNQVFNAQETALADRVRELLGPDAYTQYQEYSRNLVSHLTADQFKTMLGGDADTKDAQAKQLYQLMQEETKTALEKAGLGPDYQTIPSLNFRNIASEEEAEKNLKLLSSIYDNVAARAVSFLSPDELKKFSEFESKAINGNRIALSMNRKMMAPGN